MVLTSGWLGECNGKLIISGTKCHNRDQVLEYMKWAKPIIEKLLEVLLERLNVKQIDELMKYVVKDVLSVNLIHYPVCPSPELTVSAGRHADVLLITILLQDDIVGLYV
ncbi:putative feruloyl CoA ortho-hydroxylase 2-like [Capsicum annuum]|nr:putative feruloyl CoA ortho-hydroxylase 2-like [Capsicum annuum]